jgi:hypothetical protein
MHPSLPSTRAIICTSFLAPLPSGPSVFCLATKLQIMSEIWHQGLGRPGLTQPSLLAKHSTGLSSLLTSGLYPINSCQACNDENIGRAPMGANSDMDPLLPGTRFRLDFGFMCAPSADFGVSSGNRVVISYDGTNVPPHRARQVSLDVDLFLSFQITPSLCY